MKMRTRKARPSTLIGSLAVLCLFGGGIFAYNGLQTAKAKTWTVVVSKSMDGYTQLVPDDVHIEEKSVDSLPKDAIRLTSNIDLSGLWNKTVLANQVTVRSLHQGDVLSLSDLTKLTAALPALLVKSGHEKDIAVSIPVNPNNGMSLSKVNDGDSLYLSIQETQGDKTNPVKVTKTIDEHALVLAKDIPKEGSTDGGYVYVPLTSDEIQIIEQNGGPSKVFVGLTSTTSKSLGHQNEFP